MKVKTPGVWILLIMVIVGFLFADQNEDPAASKKGVVTYADGQVKRKTGEMENWENAPVNTDIYSGDQVRTYHQSRAELDLAKLDIIRLAPRTVVDIIKLYLETKEKNVQTLIKVVQGEVWASVHEVEMDTQFDISAPLTAAAITGTVLRMKVAEDSTTQLKVYRGEVRITNAPHNVNLVPRQIKPYEVPGPYEIQGPREISVEEWMYLVKSMQQVTINSRGQVVSAGSFRGDEEEEKSDWVMWNQKRDLQRQERLQLQKD